MPVDRRITRRFVNAGQEPRVENSISPSATRVWMSSGSRRRAGSLCRKLRHLRPSFCPRRPWFLLARTPVHFRREDIALCCRSQYLETLSVKRAFILAGCCCSRHVGAYGHAISTTQPGPGTIVNRKPCTFTIADTTFRPRPRPDVCFALSDR